MAASVRFTLSLRKCERSRTKSLCPVLMEIPPFHHVVPVKASHTDLVCEAEVEERCFSGHNYILVLAMKVPNRVNFLTLCLKP